MNNQLSHYEYKHDVKKFPIKIILDNVDDGINVGGIFRLADGFGVDEICLCGSTPLADNKRVKRTSRSTEKYVFSNYYNSTIDCINLAKEMGYKVVAVEITTNSKSLQNYEFDDKKIAIVLGNENHGISDEVLKIVDETIHIDMYGNNSSFNVATATAITLFEVVKQQLKQ